MSNVENNPLIKSHMWIEEPHKDFLRVGYRVKKSFFSDQSEFQSVDVVETAGHGRMLLNDGLVMVSERDEFIYHEMISHVPLFVHPNPQKVLIIGGGDGGTAREVLRHGSVEKCDMVEIDAMVVEACRQHLPVTAKAFDHPKLNLMIEDGVKFVAETDEKYDLVLIDSTDPIGPAQPLFNQSFYKDVERVLNEDGIVVSQGESPFYEVPMQKTLLGILGNIFEIAGIYNFPNLTYPGGFWSFTFASHRQHPLKDFKENRWRESGLDCSYYNEEIHRSAFSLPEFMKKNLEGLIKI